MRTTTMLFDILNAELNLDDENLFSNATDSTDSTDAKPLEVYVLLRSSLDTGLRVIGISYKLNDPKDVYQLRMLCKMAGGSRFLSTIVGKQVRAIVNEDDEKLHKVVSYGYPSCDVFAVFNGQKHIITTEAKAKAILTQ